MKPRVPILNRPVVLVVEDEPLVRILQVEILREGEFWVVDANDADEAFEILRHRRDVSVVVTDVDMPGSLNGFEFARLVKQGWPEVGVLVISGKTAPLQGDLPAGAVFVGKPIRPAALITHVREALGARARSQAPNPAATAEDEKEEDSDGSQRQR